MLIEADTLGITLPLSTKEPALKFPIIITYRLHTSKCPGALTFLFPGSQEKKKTPEDCPLGDPPKWAAGKTEL